VVERTFSWLGQNRRMSEDYERLAETSEALVYVAMTRVTPVDGYTASWIPVTTNCCLWRERKDL
jgi:hypothetical protein